MPADPREGLSPMVCVVCRCRFRWHESERGRCYWCETGSPDGETNRALVETPSVPRRTSDREKGS